MWLAGPVFLSVFVFVFVSAFVSVFVGGRVKVCLCTPAQSSEKCVLLGREGTSCASPCFIAGEVFVGRGLDPAGWAQHMKSIFVLCLCNCTHAKYKYIYKNSWRVVCRAGPRPTWWAQTMAVFCICVCLIVFVQIQNANTNTKRGGEVFLGRGKWVEEPD